MDELVVFVRGIRLKDDWPEVITVHKNSLSPPLFSHLCANPSLLLVILLRTTLSGSVKSCVIYWIHDIVI